MKPGNVLPVSVPPDLDRKKYQAEASHLRNVLGQIQRIAHLGAGDPGEPTRYRLDRAVKHFADIRQVSHKALERAPTNGEVMDAMNELIGQLRSQLVDQGVLRAELSMAKQAADDARRELAGAQSELDAIREMMRASATEGS